MSAKEDLSKTFGDVGNYDDMVVEKTLHLKVIVSITWLLLLVWPMLRTFQTKK